MTDPLQLLKQLEPAVRPAYAAGPASGAQPPIEHQRFDELLSRASQGLVESGRPVTSRIEGARPLDEQQLARLAQAADRAEAAGARRAVVLMDGRGLVLEVPERALAAELSEECGSDLFPVDAAVYIAGDDGHAESSPLPLPARVASPAVADQIEAAVDASRGADRQGRTAAAG